MEKAITRRACATRLFAAGALLPVGASALKGQDDAPPPLPQFRVEDAQELVLREQLPGVERKPSDRLELSVAIRTYKENELERLEPEHQDAMPRYKREGDLLPEDFFPGRPMITRFDLTWGGNAVPVEARFWNDLTGMWLRRLVLPDKLPADPEERWEHEFNVYEQQTALRSPSITLSAHGGTALITWPRPEE